MLPSNPFPRIRLQNIRQKVSIFHTPKEAIRNTNYPFHGGIYNDGHSAIRTVFSWLSATAATLIGQSRSQQATISM